MKGYIYKITNQNESIVYVGSTTLTIEHRWRAHTIAFNRWNEGKIRCAAMIYHHFREQGIDAFGIHLISEHEIEDRKSLLQFEQLVIDSTKCVNKQAAWITEEARHEQKLAYREAHRNEQRSAASEVIQCECGETYTRGHKGRHVQTERHRYGIASEEERKNIDEAREEADYERKEALKARRNARVECECGTSYPKAGKSHHVRKSKAHLKWLADRH
ncbi:unnamed protein product [Phytophthora fragariaefolia]|uniref:Unnamed protein product n=1 Tax=Phytophthora fragariaefolia TaxID=1490495 RepID=A0A9W7D0P0_9STRA|nr:unnamed protein product [Phytophthora fragariaefolia]